MERLKDSIAACGPILQSWPNDTYARAGNCKWASFESSAFNCCCRCRCSALSRFSFPCGAMTHTLPLSPNALWRRTGGSHGWMAMDSVCIYAVYMIFTCCVFSELISKKWFKTASLESCNWEWLFDAPESCGVPPLFLKLQPAPGPCQAQRCTSRAWRV